MLRAVSEFDEEREKKRTRLFATVIWLINCAMQIFARPNDVSFDNVGFLARDKWLKSLSFLFDAANDRMPIARAIIIVSA